MSNRIEMKLQSCVEVSLRPGIAGMHRIVIDEELDSKYQFAVTDGDIDTLIEGLQQLKAKINK